MFILDPLVIHVHTHTTWLFTICWWCSDLFRCSRCSSNLPELPQRCLHVDGNKVPHSKQRANLLSGPWRSYCHLSSRSLGGVIDGAFRFKNQPSSVVKTSFFQIQLLGLDLWSIWSMWDSSSGLTSPLNGFNSVLVWIIHLQAAARLLMENTDWLHPRIQFDLFLGVQTSQHLLVWTVMLQPELRSTNQIRVKTWGSLQSLEQPTSEGYYKLEIILSWKPISSHRLSDLDDLSC